MKFETKYRIIRDHWSGYEAQFRYWWFPFWNQCFFANTSSTLDDAIIICKVHAGKMKVEEIKDALLRNRLEAKLYNGKVVWREEDEETKS